MKFRFLFLSLFLFIGCSQSPVHSRDDFDKIIAIMRTKSTSDLVNSFGKPDEISNPEHDNKIQILRYKKSRIDAYVKKSTPDRITHLTLFFWEDFDNYIYLKKRFQKFGWTEKKLPDPIGDVATDLYQVTIPDIKMSFQYDNNAPKRKVMWISFE